MSTIKDVARLAGVSTSTVSKYINGGNVRQDKLAPIKSAIAELDYRVNPFARSLKTQRSMTVGLLLPSAFVTFFSTVLTSAEQVLRRQGYYTLAAYYDSKHGLERSYLNHLINMGVDGIIYAPEDLTAEEFKELTSGRSVPVVQFDRIIPGVEADAVLCDNAEASHQAVNMLIANGHRRIAIITGRHSIFTGRERTAGYLRALDQSGIPYDDALSLSGDFSFATGYRGFARLMALETPPTAIFATNYDITLGLVSAARERGLRIPEDIEVFGYDYIEDRRTMSTSLPVVSQPEEEIGLTVANYLIERLEGFGGEPRQTRLHCRLVI